jgi:hypothetical protein
LEKPRKLIKTRHGESERNEKWSFGETEKKKLGFLGSQ